MEKSVKIWKKQTTINQVDLIDIYGTLPQQQQNTCFSSQKHTIMDYKTNLETFRRIQVMQNMFSDYNGMKIEIYFIYLRYLISLQIFGN